MKYEWLICSLNDAEAKLKMMREAGWHPVSHSIWVDTCAQRMASFIFRKKEEKDVKKFVKQRVDELQH